MLRFRRAASGFSCNDSSILETGIGLIAYLATESGLQGAGFFQLPGGSITKTRLRGLPVKATASPLSSVAVAWSEEQPQYLKLAFSG